MRPYASLYEIMPQHAPEVIKLSYITILKFHRKVRTKENRVMRNFKICAVHKILSGRSNEKNEIF
jgi:hypothetical protein